MPAKKPVLHLVCGKIASGKSTLAGKLASQPQTVLINEDQWLSTLYPEEMNSIADYVNFSGRLRTVMGQHVDALLRAGLCVVLDFPANTVDFRQWMRGIFENAEAAHELHFLDVADDVCKQRLRQRNESGQHEFAPTDEDFDLISGYFVPPSAAENFNIVLYSGDSP
jgi:predicted kinase